MEKKHTIISSEVKETAIQPLEKKQSRQELSHKKEIIEDTQTKKTSASTTDNQEEKGITFQTPQQGLPPMEDDSEEITKAAETAQKEAQEQQTNLELEKLWSQGKEHLQPKEKDEKNNT
jgi:predicted DsbA family dithiol-disulfide isomerase